MEASKPTEPVRTKEIAIVNPDWKTAKMELRYVALVEDDEAVNRLVATLNAYPARATLKADGQPVYVPPFVIKEVPSGS